MNPPPTQLFRQQWVSYMSEQSPHGGSTYEARTTQNPILTGGRHAHGVLRRQSTSKHEFRWITKACLRPEKPRGARGLNGAPTLFSHYYNGWVRPRLFCSVDHTSTFFRDLHPVLSSDLGPPSEITLHINDALFLWDIGPPLSISKAPRSDKQTNVGAGQDNILMWL